MAHSPALRQNAIFDCFAGVEWGGQTQPSTDCPEIYAVALPCSTCPLMPARKLYLLLKSMAMMADNCSKDMSSPITKMPQSNEVAYSSSAMPASNLQFLHKSIAVMADNGSNDMSSPSSWMPPNWLDAASNRVHYIQVLAVASSIHTDLCTF